MLGLRRQPDLHGALAAYQREADRQAAKWIERELVGLMRGRPAFDGHTPLIVHACST